MTSATVASANETYLYDSTKGAGSIVVRSVLPPQDAPLTDLDDHFLGARLLGPIKPWFDDGGSTGAQSSPGSAHAVVGECLMAYADAAASLKNNADKSFARPANFPKVTPVCWTGGLPPCAGGTVNAWDPQHEFRGLRHLIAWRRFGWPSDKFLAACAIDRVLAEPYIMQGKSNNQRAYGWPLLLLAESLSTELGQKKPDVTAGITTMLGVLQAKSGPNYLTLNTEAGNDHGGLPVCSWQHAVLTRALGRLVRRGWADPRAYSLYKSGVKGLDAMVQPNTFGWWKDWKPSTGEHLDAETLYGGTSLWTACAYAESLAVLTAAAPQRKDFLLGFMGSSNMLKPTDKNYDASSHALLAALVN